MQQLTVSNSLVFTGGPVIAMESAQSAEQDVDVLLQFTVLWVKMEATMPAKKYF